MDAYPSDYVDHNLPLIVISGLGSPLKLENEDNNSSYRHGAGSAVTSDFPAVEGDRAAHLLQEFLSADANPAPWNGRAIKGKDGLLGFRIRATGRYFTLPPKKAPPPESLPGPTPLSTPVAAQFPPSSLHSPISPLTPGSPTYPDGVMTSEWIKKHQSRIPCAFVSFFTLSSDPTRNSLNDNQLKSEINRIKSIFQDAEYKTRYAVVLVSDASAQEAVDLDERVTNVRRGTGLDSKSSLFVVPATASKLELGKFVTGVLSTLQPLCVEYYRDLTKHARRKKNRGQIPLPTIPPTRGTSQALGVQGWAIRYDFKLGVFAEFRQEMDAAGRHYTSALDALLSSEGIFETTASWSPRWNEARLFADVIAIRSIRCMLWNNQNTSAVQSWQEYRLKMRDIIDRKGKGSSSYGWEAWQSRWAKIMAELVQRADLAAFIPSESWTDSSTIVQKDKLLYAPAEKAYPVGERLAPWYLLHHPGYWLRLAGQFAVNRRDWAEDIPEEDRTAPGKSTAAQIAGRNRTYDSYLVPEPHIENPLEGTGGFDHNAEIVNRFSEASAQFFSHGQQRSVDYLNLQIGKELIRANRHVEAISTLRPLWEGMSWRKEGWWNLVADVAMALHVCARRTKDLEAVLAAEWELQSKCLSHSSPSPSDFMHCLQSIDTDHHEAELVELVVDSSKVSCPILPSFAFSNIEGFVGEPMPSQLVITSHAKPDCTPIEITSVSIAFSGCLGQIRIGHSPSGQPHETSSIEKAAVSETSSTTREQKPAWNGIADLTIHSGQLKVIEFPLIFRESGQLNALSIIIEVCTESFSFSCSYAIGEEGKPRRWWLPTLNGVKPKQMDAIAGPTCTVLPKPPKMEIKLPNMSKQYYTDEEIALDVELHNMEEEETEIVLELRLLGRSKESLEYSWMSKHETSLVRSSTAEPAKESETPIDLPGHPVGRLDAGASSAETFRLRGPLEPSEYTLEIKALYHLLSDRDVPVSKTLTAELVFVSAFEASYDFNPRVHPDPWPCYFEMSEIHSDGGKGSAAFGIPQRWQLNARIASFAEEPLFIEDANVVIQTVHGGATCTASNGQPTDGGRETPIAKHELHERSFSVEVRKHNIEERRSTALDMALAVRWRRASPLKFQAGASTTSRVLVPRLLVPSSEPRVLASATPSTVVLGLFQLAYTLENPTAHLLTFELTMEASEDFALAGHKLRRLAVLPMSRKTVRYGVLPLKRGLWIAPQLKVVDGYFNKTLKVLPTDGMRVDKKGVSLWVDADEEDGAEKGETGKGTQ